MVDIVDVVLCMTMMELGLIDKPKFRGRELPTSELAAWCIRIAIAISVNTYHIYLPAQWFSLIYFL